ncbi:MAG: hypothetical protein J7M13_00130 [Synergistetes bacterium]|nr:hypothetical protein [Synergistota bacterium]
MKFFFWDLGAYLGKILLALVAGGGIALIAAIIAFIFWDKADILEEEIEEEGESRKSSASIFWRVLAVVVGGLGCIWGISAFIDTIKFLF